MTVSLNLVEEWKVKGRIYITWFPHIFTSLPTEWLSAYCITFKAKIKLSYIHRVHVPYKFIRAPAKVSFCLSVMVKHFDQSYIFNTKIEILLLSLNFQIYR